MIATVKRIWKKSIAILLSFSIMAGTISDLNVSASAEENVTNEWEMLESFDSSSDEYAQLKDMLTNTNAVTFFSNTSVQGNYMSNDYIAMNVVNNGRFTIGTTGGNPNNLNDDNKKMIYGHPGGSTSYTTVRVDGTSYTYSASGTNFNNENACNTSNNVLGGLNIEQKLSIVENSATGREDVVEIKYTITNNTDNGKKVGLRIMLDTMLGNNDAAPFRVPQYGSITTETEFVGDEIPQFWQAFDNLTNPSVIAQGRFYRSQEEKPDKVQFTNWRRVYNNSWGYSIIPGSGNGDSAVSVIWNEAEIAPNETKEYVTYYGLSEFTEDLSLPLALSVYSDNSVNVVNDRYAPNPVDVIAYVQNLSNITAKNVKIEIELPDGLELAAGESIIDLGELSPNQLTQLAWSVAIKPTPVESNYQYNVILTSDGDYRKEVSRTIHVPALKQDKTLEYTIFSGSNTADLNLYGWKSSFNGNVYTGKNFNYGGSEFYVDGRIDAVGNIITNGWKTEITERCENVEKESMPELDASIHEMAFPFETFDQSPTYVQDKNIINSSIKVNGDVVISGTTFEGDCYIIAEGNITYNVQSFNSAGRVLLYSRNGNITINGSQINVNGAMYAPNGNVTFNTYDTTVTGFIYSDSINFNGSIFNITGANFDMVNPAPKGIVKTYTTDSDFNEGTLNGVSLAVHDQLVLANKDSEDIRASEKIYGDTETGKGIKIAYSSDKSMLSPDDESINLKYDLSGFGEADVNSNAVDLILVVDESGSMSGSRMNNTKAAAKEIISQMKVEDRCAVVGFTNFTSVKQELTSDKTLLNSAVDRLHAGGGTSIYRGIDAALSMFDSMSGDERQKFIILLSDGEDGSTTQSLCSAKAAGEKGVRIFALMIGTGTLQMQNIAINSNGIYKNAPTNDDIGKIMSFFASEVFNVAGRSTTLKTTIIDGSSVDISAISPNPTSVVENPDGSVSIEWSFDRISIDESETISIPVTVSENIGSFADLTKNTSCVYYDRDGKPHVIYLDDVSVPVSKYADSGTWSVVYDSDRENTNWSKVYWNGIRHGDGKITVTASVSDDGEEFGEPVSVINYGEISELSGRYIKLDVNMLLSSDGRTPELYDITVMSEDADDIIHENNAPTVSISAKDTVGVNRPVTLRAVISDDLNGGEITVKWSSENGSVTFENDESLITAATVSEICSCDIICTVSDGDKTVQAISVMNVIQPEHYDDIDPDKEIAMVPEISVNIPQYADRNQKIEAKIENLNNTEISWYSVIFRGNQAINVADDGSFTFTTPNSNGTYHLTIRGFDWAGNSDVKDFDIMVNNDMPNIEIVPSSESVGVGENAYFTVSTSYASKIKSIKYTLNGEDVNINENGIYSLETLVVGEYELRAEAVTVSGKQITTTAKISVIHVDVTSPTFSYKISWNEDVPHVGQPVLTEVDAEDDSGTVYVEVFVDGEPISGNDNVFEYVPETAGEHIIFIKAYDDARNITTYEHTLIVYESSDVTPPTGSLSINKVTAYVGEEITVQIEASDDRGEVLVAASVNGTTLEVVNNAISFVPDKPGEYTVVVSLTDAAGNEVLLYQSVVVTLFDDTPPVLTVGGIPGKITVGRSIEIAVEASDENGEVFLTITANGNELEIFEGKASFTPDIVGEYKIVITATDVAGNFVIHEYTIICVEEIFNEDVVPPVGSVAFNKTCASVGDEIIAVIEASDDSGEVFIKATVNGNDVEVTDNEITFIPNEIGIYTFVIIVSDAAGNAASLTHEIMIVNFDTTAPDLTINGIPETVTVGQKVEFSVEATDDSGDVVIVVTVNNTPVDIVNGKVEFTPDATGEYSIAVTASDQFENSITKEYKIVVCNNDTTSPIGNLSFDSEYYLVGDKITAEISASDDSGEVTVDAKINGISIDIVDNRIEYTPNKAGIFTFAVTLSDPSGNTTSIIKSIFVVEPSGDTIHPDLEIISFPAQAIVGEKVKLEFRATDDSGEVFVTVTVNGNEIGVNDGTAVFTPEYEGNYDVIISVYDAAGNSISASGAITACASDDTTLPTMSITGLTPYMTRGETIVIDINASDDSGSIYVTATINDKSVEITDNKIEFIPNEVGTYKFMIRAEDPSGNYVQKEYNILVTEPLNFDDGKPVVTIYANNGSDTVNIGETVTFQVSANDPDGIKSVSVTVNEKELKLDADGKANFTPDEIGRYTITVKAQDNLGNEISESLKIKVIDPADNSVCTIAITSPLDGSVVTSPIEVTGNVSGEGLVYYVLEYCPSGGTQYTEFASGNIAVNNGILGIFDPTLLENGYYNIRLTARSSNYSVSDEIVVSVEGQMKIGNYSIAFQDMDIPVAGYPLTVIRNYDSRRKSTSGDFGYGWDMTLSSIKLSESCEPGLYWTQKTANSGFVTKYYFAEDKTHEISIDYGNGKTDKFKMKLSPDQRNLYPIQYDISVSYEPQGNTKSKLEVIGKTTELIYTGNTLCYSDSIKVYNPSKYKLTRPDGTVYIISDVNGVESITDTNGNVITFTENEVKHSDGKSIVFERDSENRVIRISDPYGKTVKYSYSSNGDLTSVTDKAGETTTFKYDRNHYLTEIIDSRGIKVARNEYDDNGRLIATIDANGNRLEFSHDVDGRQDVVTDRLGYSTIYIYDGRGNVISETDALGNTTLSTYDSNGNLETKTDALGNVTTYNYDSQGNLLSVTNALGETVTNTYTEKGQLKTITSMGITQFVVDYDDFGNLTSTTDAEDNKTKYGYDRDGRVISITDGIGSYMHMSYDSDGRVISSVNGNGETVTFTYDSEGNCASKTVTRTTANGVESLTEKYAYDVYGNVTQIIYADGSVTNTEYDSVGNMTAAVDAKGRRTTYDYDLYGNLVKITYCDNTTETFEYDAENRNIKATDRLGRTVEMTYDAVGNLVEKTYPNGSEVSYVYDAKYRLVSTTEANGGTTKYEYDALDRNTAIIDALGNRTKFGYSTTNGQLETMTDPKGNTYTYGYDRNGNRTSVTMPDGTTVTTAYDARGRIISQTDQHGYTTKYTYDGADRLTSVTDALGSTWRYAYDSVGEIISITDANGNTTRYEYDSCGRVVKTTNAKGSTATVTYDEIGNVLTSTDYAGNTTSYVYDDLDRVVSKTVGSDSVFYTYTDDGMLSSVSNKNGAITYTYDLMNGLKSVTTYDGSTIEYNYDNACRLTAVETPFGTTQYEYDLMDKLVRVVAHDGTATLYEYDVNGNRTAVRYANGIVASYEYDEVNRLVREKVLDKNGAPVVEYEYTLGAAGERLKVVETGRTVEYEYDELYRLVKETVTDSNGTTVTEYTYDRNSNRLTKTVDGHVTEYAYNELNQLVSETGIFYEYDLNGNLVKKTEGEQTTTYTYNSQNRLIRVTVQSGQQVNVEEYRYDYAGNRIAKIGELSTTYYLVDTNGALSQVLAEYDENGSLTTYYTRGEELISQERNGVKSYYLYDGFDSVRMLTDDEGNVTDTYTFDAFGNLTESTGDTENSYLYRGEQFDSFTGLYYLRARYMNPSTGTFITMDEYAGSVFEPVSLHKYLYANANPVTYCDPTGYSSSLADVETTSAGMAIVSEAYSSACMSAARIGARILLLLKNSLSISVMTAPFFFPLASALGDICGGLLDGTESSASICEDVKDNIVEDTLPDAAIDTAAESDVADEDNSKKDKSIYFPADPNNFKPNVLKKAKRGATKNGLIIQWVDESGEPVFAWHENTEYENGPHYHICKLDKGKPNKEHTHFYAFDQVPEPWASLYFN